MVTKKATWIQVYATINVYDGCYDDRYVGDCHGSYDGTKYISLHVTTMTVVTTVATMAVKIVSVYNGTRHPLSFY